MESCFDGKLYKNKIWIGTVEGEETLFFFYVFVSFGFQIDLKFLSVYRFACTFHRTSTSEQILLERTILRRTR